MDAKKAFGGHRPTVDLIQRVERFGCPLPLAGRVGEEQLFSVGTNRLLVRVAFRRAQYDESCRLCSGGSFCSSFAPMIE